MGPRVLLLDEDAPFLSEAQTSLESVGCDVTALRSGDSGLARAVTDRFDLVVASAELPAVNGFRLCNRIKKDAATKSVPVILLTGAVSAASAGGHRQLATRADVYLDKPVVMAELLAQVRAHAHGNRQSSDDERPTERMRAAQPLGAAPVLPLPSRSHGSSLPPPRPRAPTMAGVAPAPKTVPPAQRPPDGSATIHRLAKDLATARREAEATATLRARIAEMQRSMDQLTRELGEARAAAAAASTEVERLRRERTSRAPPPSSPPAADTTALREQLKDHDEQILALRTALDSEQQAAAEAWERVRLAEEAHRGLEKAVRARDDELAKAEKRFGATKVERDTAVRRAEDAARRAEKERTALAQAHEALESERTARAQNQAQLAQLSAAAERSTQEARDRMAAATAEHERMLAEKTAELRASYAAEIAGLTRQLTDARAAVEHAAPAARSEAERAVAAELQVAQRDFERRLEVTVAAGARALEDEKRARWQLGADRDRLAREVDELRASIESTAQGGVATDRRIEELERALARQREEAERRIGEAIGRERQGAADRVAHATADAAAAVALEQDRARRSVREAEEERDRGLVIAQQALAASEERRARDVAEARAAREAVLARLDHEQVKMELQRDAAIADATLELRLALVKAAKERDEAIAAARSQARVEMDAAVQAQREADRDEATAELRIELEGARAAAVSEMRRAHLAEIERLSSERNLEQAEAKARADTLDQALSAARDALEKERRARIEERTSAGARIDALEQLAGSRSEEVQQYRREADDLHGELAALEAEIAVLRTELTEMRRKFSEQTELARTADDQLERQRALLALARDTLAGAMGPGVEHGAEDGEKEG
jgi:CheY-like chemotaxis protein